MGIKVFLDDARITPEGWVRAYSAEEALHLLLSQEVEWLSLDYDLDLVPVEQEGLIVEAKVNPDAKNGTWLVREMIERNRWPLHLCIHSMNPTGVKEMQALIDAFGPYEK